MSDFEELLTIKLFFTIKERHFENEKTFCEIKYILKNELLIMGD